MASDLARKTIEIANGEVGVREDPLGSNSGPRVSQYQAVCHAKAGDAWCACFACWCIRQAGQALNVVPKLKFSASALHLWDINPDAQIHTLTADDIPCVGIYDHGAGKGHVILICGLDEATGGLISIEGNSNDNGSREGIGVFALHSRNVKDSQFRGGLAISA